jgi:hypothetical protein
MFAQHERKKTRTVRTEKDKAYTNGKRQSLHEWKKTKLTRTEKDKACTNGKRQNQSDKEKVAHRDKK